MQQKHMNLGGTFYVKNSPKNRGTTNKNNHFFFQKTLKTPTEQNVHHLDRPRCQPDFLNRQISNENYENTCYI